MPSHITTHPTEPQFKSGDRVFSHYTMTWGTVTELEHTERGRTRGDEGTPLPDTTWYTILMDNGRSEYLDDGHGNWDMARIVPPYIAKRYGYGTDPRG